MNKNDINSYLSLNTSPRLPSRAETTCGLCFNLVLNEQRAHQEHNDTKTGQQLGPIHDNTNKIFFAGNQYEYLYSVSLLFLLHSRSPRNVFSQ